MERAGLGFEDVERLGGERLCALQLAVSDRAERVAVELYRLLDGIVDVARHVCVGRRA